MTIRPARDCLIMAFSVRLEQVIHLHTDHTKRIRNRHIDGLQKIDTKLQDHWRFWVSVKIVLLYSTGTGIGLPLGRLVIMVDFLTD